MGLDFIDTSHWGYVHTYKSTSFVTAKDLEVVDTSNHVHLPAS